MAYTKNATWVDSPSTDTLVTAAKLNNIEDGICNAAATADAAIPAANPIITDWSYRDAFRSTSAFAWKGNAFTPDLPVTLHAIAFYGTVVAGATYQAAVVTGTSTVATIVKSAAVTMPGTLASTDGGHVWLWFAEPVALTVGTEYGLLVGRTDGAGTYPLPVPYGGTTSAEWSVPMPGRSHGRSWRATVTDLQVGSALDTITTNTVGAGYAFSHTPA